MAVKPSVLGALREKLLGDSVVAPLIPGKVHANQLPPNPTYPAVVLRWPKTEFGYQTQGEGGERATFWKPFVEIWIDCVGAESGEVIGGAIFDLLLSDTLPYSAGQVVQCLPEDFFLAPETSRNAQGELQYSWCLPTRLSLLRVTP